MKVSTSSLKSQTNRRQVVPVIPLTRPETKVSLTKGEYSVLKCKTTPDVEGAATYDLPIPYFKTGTAEEFLRWKRNVQRALTGQNVTTGPGQYNLTRKLMDGDALMVFNIKATELVMKPSRTTRQSWPPLPRMSSLSKPSRRKSVI